MPDRENIMKLAGLIRIGSLKMVHSANASHIGSCLSMVDILAVLYGKTLKVDPRNPAWEERDRFILSKGHGAAAFYATLAESGFFSSERLRDYCKSGLGLPGHATSHGIPGVELSTGSLGHGLPVACGMALAGKREDRPYRVFVLLSDGEMDEGSNWESILFAAQHGLDNLVAIVDCNTMQGFGSTKDVIDLSPLPDKWKSFRWSVKEVDGHDHGGIEGALGALPFAPGSPSVVIAHTIKGKGVSFMEGQLAWHYRSPDKDQLAAAIAEIEGAL